MFKFKFDTTEAGDRGNLYFDKKLEERHIAPSEQCKHKDL